MLLTLFLVKNILLNHYLFLIGLLMILILMFLYLYYRPLIQITPLLNSMWIP
nr:MAG TPA: hypothetical protein [Caudoviricetes sp.]